MAMELIAAELPRSTCHQAFVSKPVWVTEPPPQFPLVFPSTAAPGVFNALLLCVADLACARLLPAVGGVGSCTCVRLPTASVVKIFQLPAASVTLVVLPA